MVENKGLEPLHLSILDPKSSASTNSANSPYVPAYIYEKRYTKTSGLSFSLLLINTDYNNLSKNVSKR